MKKSNTQNFYKFSYKSKANNRLYALLQNLLIALTSVLFLYCAFEFCTNFKFDIFDYFVKIVVFGTLIIFLFLDVIFFTTKQGIKICENGIKIYFGYMDIALHPLIKFIEYNNIISCGISSEEISSREEDVSGGNYRPTYIKLQYNKNKIYNIPIKDLDSFLEELNMHISEKERS